MPSAVPFPILAPGFNGLNTELANTVGLIDELWALGLEHAVFDDVSCPAMSKETDSWMQSSGASFSLWASCATYDDRRAAGASSAAEARMISAAVSRKMAMSAVALAQAVRSKLANGPLAKRRSMSALMPAAADA